MADGRASVVLKAIKAIVHVDILLRPPPFASVIHTLRPRHAACRPWHCSSGKTGGRRLAHLANCVRPCGRPSGDFCSRLFRCSPSLTLNLPKGSHSDQVRCSFRGLCAFYRHAGVIVPPGEPPDGTSPAVMPRRHHGGGAGSSPRNHRHDRCSRWEELTGSMEETRKAWRKGEKKNAGSAEASGFQGLTGASLSTFRRPPSVIPGLVSDWKERRVSGIHAVALRANTPMPEAIPF
jgi:hypothetical protein